MLGLRRVWLFSFFVLLIASRSRAADIYLDTSQPIETRVDDLIGRMTLEEKALSLFHNSPGIPRLHIPAWDGWNQCLHGIWAKRVTTLFPVSIAMGATWDPGLVHSEAEALSDEGRALYNIHAIGPHGPHGLVYRGPVINISRDPRWGRIQECYGEDPYLTSRIGVAYVKGLQGDDPKYLKVASTLKHFAINNQENGRLGLSATVPERMMYEYWLPHFKACVEEGHAQSVMAAYNAINGTPCNINKLLLTDILRGQWGFDGFVVSDLGAIKHLMDGHHLTKKAQEAAAWAIEAGCDYDDEEFRDGLPVAVKAGLVSEEVVNRALKRVLTVAYRLGVFDAPENVPWSKVPESVIDSQEHRNLALKMARESIVLLTNKDRFLPLDKSKLKTVGIIGPAAEHPEYGNYYEYNPKQNKVSPLQGIRDRLGDSVEILQAQGCPMTGTGDPAAVDKAVQTAKQAEVVLLFLGTNLKVEAEDRDRKELGLPGDQEKLLEAVCQANPKTVVILMNGGPLSVVWGRDHTAAMLEAWYAGEEGGHAIADVLLGDFNPGGKLPYTVYESTKDVPLQTEYDVTKGFTYMFFKGAPVFPFGHGLSYSQFEYSDLKLSTEQMPDGGSLNVSVNVKNTGKVAGAEVVQLYIHQQKCSVAQAIKKLVGFRRVELAPGQSSVIEIPIKAEQLAFYDVGSKQFLVEPGAFDVMVGSSSADVRLKGQLTVAQPQLFKP